MVAIDPMGSLIDFYNDHEFDNLMMKIEELISHNKHHKLSIFSVISDYNLIEILKTKRIENFKINVKKREDYWKIEIHRVIERNDIKEGGRRTISGSAFVKKSDHREKIWNIITIEELDFQKNCIERMIDLLRPKVSRFFLTSKEIKSIFTSFNDKEYDILVKKAVLYSHKEEGKISFEKVPYYKVFYEAEESDAYVDKIEFIMYRNHKFVLHGFIAREGVSKFIEGDIKFFYEKFLSLLENYGEDKRKKLNKKEKNIQNYHLNPLAIKFREEIIKGKKDNRRIIFALQNLPRSSILVYHANPYLHLSLLDFIDGTSCDIFISSPDEISVIPSYSSSLSSLMRIFDQISKYFQEGEIIEKRRKNIQFLDFFE